MSLCVRTSMANSLSCITLMHKILINGRGYMCSLWDIDHHMKTVERRLYFMFRQSNCSESRKLSYTNPTMYTASPSLQAKKTTEPSNAELTDRKNIFMPENSKLCHPTSYPSLTASHWILIPHMHWSLSLFAMFNYYHHFKCISFHWRAAEHSFTIL